MSNPRLLPPDAIGYLRDVGAVAADKHKAIERATDLLVEAARILSEASSPTYARRMLIRVAELIGEAEATGEVAPGQVPKLAKWTPSPLPPKFLLILLAALPEGEHSAKSIGQALHGTKPGVGASPEAIAKAVTRIRRGSPVIAARRMLEKSLGENLEAAGMRVRPEDLADWVKLLFPLKALERDK